MTGNTRKGVCNSDGCKTLTSEWLWNLLLWESLGLVNFTWLFTAKMRQISQSICYSRIKVKNDQSNTLLGNQNWGLLFICNDAFRPRLLYLRSDQRKEGERGERLGEFLWHPFTKASICIVPVRPDWRSYQGARPHWMESPAWTRACIIANISKFHHWDEENIPECKTRSFLLYWLRPHAKICLLVCSFLSHWWFIHGETCLISQQGVFGPGVCYKPHAGRRIGGPQIKIWSEGKAMDQMTFLK